MGKPVHDLGLNGMTKFRASRFHFGIVFTICTNQFHLPVTCIKDKF